MKKEKFIRDFEKRSTDLISLLETLMDSMSDSDERVAELEAELQDANARIDELEEDLKSTQEIQAAESDSDDYKLILEDFLFEVENALVNAKTAMDELK